MTEMTDKDYVEASMALLDWLDRQGISPGEAGRVLTMTLVATIKGLAKNMEADPKEGGRIITRIITESLK